MNAVRVLVFALLAMVACAELPTAPAEAPLSEPTSAGAPKTSPKQLPLPPACTHHWISETGGDFSDAANWDPTSVPSDTVHHACIDAPGTYVVSATVFYWLGSLTVGGPSVSARMELIDASLATDDGLVIEPGSTVSLSASSFGMSIHGQGEILNRGTLEVDGTTSGIYAVTFIADMTNEGSLVLSQGAYFHGDLLNLGDILVDSPYWSSIDGNSDFIHAGGTVRGESQLIAPAGLEWQGGTVDTTSSGTAALRVSREHYGSVPSFSTIVSLQSTSVSGHLDIHGRSDAITVLEGSVGPNLELRLEAEDRHEFRFENSYGSFSNYGAVRVQKSGPTSPPDADVIIFDRFFNRGDFDLEGGGQLDLKGDRFDNRGSVVIDGAFVLERGAQWENRGTVSVGSGSALQLQGSEFLNRPAGQLTGLLWLEGGTLSGRGSVGDVLSTNGNIKPGFPLGTLQVQTLLMDPKSALFIDVSGTALGQYDRLVVTGNLSYAGTINVATDAGFSGARCGELVTIVEAGAVSPGGDFAKQTGLGFLGPNRGWRLAEVGPSLQLVGHAPRTGVVVDPARLAVDEGGPASDYHVCLGVDRPAADVTVTPSSARGEITGMAPVVFSVSDWMLPRRVSVQAVDDASAEGPHADTLTHAVASADPVYQGAMIFPLPVTITDNDVVSDLSIEKIRQEDGRFVGDSLDTTFRVTNHGPSDASHVEVVTSTLDGLGYLTASGATCGIDGSGGLACALPDLGAGESAEFVLTFEGLVVGVHSHTLTVTADLADPNLADNTVVYTQRIN